MNFEWDKNKEKLNIQKHGTTFEQASYVFSDPFVLSMYDNEHSSNEDRWVILRCPMQGKFDQDVKRFVDAIGAKELSPDNDNCSDMVERMISAVGREFLFKKHNYFQLNKKWMIIKISRSKKPFWGVGKKFINSMNQLDDYYLVLLVSSRRGYVFSKSEMNTHIKSKEWNLEKKGKEYKINSPLPDKNKNSFLSPRKFLEMTGLSAEDNAT